MADLFPKIYDGTRNIKLLKEDKTTWEARINDPNHPDGHFDMTAGTYEVSVTTGPSYSTKRAESADAMVQLSQSYPPLMQVAGPEIVRAMDWPGAEMIAEALERAMPPELQKPVDQEDIPPQVQAILKQGQAAIEQLQQALQQQGAELQQAQQELQSKQMDFQGKQADLQLKAAQLQAEQQDASLKAQNEQMKLQIEQQKLQLFAEENQLKAQELALKDKDMELKNAQSQMQFYQAQMQPAASGIDTNDENQLQAQILTVQQMKSQKQAELDQKAQSDDADRQTEQMKTQALMQGIDGIQSMLAQLTNSINTPAKVIYGDNGRIAGVIKQG